MSVSKSRRPGVLLLLCVLLGGSARLSAQEKLEFPSLAPAVGIKVTVTDERPELLEADLDLTWYTRVGPYPSTIAGTPAAGYPALDYGDGATMPYTTLALASAGGGPGGTNVYRNLASFTHTYPSLGSYTVTGASFCTACLRTQYVLFPPGSPVPGTFTATYDYLPTTVVGNLAGRQQYSDTLDYVDFSVRYRFTGYLAVTNTDTVDLSIPVPMASPWGLLALGGLLTVVGVSALRRV